MCSRLKISFYVNKALRMYNLYPYDVTYTKSDLTDMWANVGKNAGAYLIQKNVNKCRHYTYIRIYPPRCPTEYSS